MTAGTALLSRLARAAVCLAAFAPATSLLHAQMTVPGASQQAATESPSAIATVLMTGLQGERASFTAADIATLPRKNVTVFDGHSKVKETYGGVLLSDLLPRLHAPLGAKLHGKALGMYLIIEGADHYTAVYSLAEVDPAFHPGSVLVADTMNGQVLSSRQGPLQLINTEDQRPARWVRNLTAIHLVSTTE